MYIIQKAAVLSSKICVMLIPLHRCLVTFGVLPLFLTMLSVGQQRIIVVLSDHTHLLFSYSSILLFKTQQNSVIGVIHGDGVGIILQFLEHRI